MQNILVKCPICSSEEIISLSNDEINKIVSHINKEGKSPFYLMKCKNGHAFTVVLSYNKGNNKLYVRDISPVIASIDSNNSKDNDNNNKGSWIMRHFG